MVVSAHKYLQNPGPVGATIYHLAFTAEDLQDSVAMRTGTAAQP